MLRQETSFIGNPANETYLLTIYDQSEPKDFQIFLKYLRNEGS